MSLMGYRSTLLRSVIALTVFYSLAGMVAFYAMGPEALQAWLEARGFWDAGRGDINPANAASAATEAVVARVDNVWPWLVGGMGVGTLIVLMVVLVGRVVRRYRAKSRGEFRGMDLTITSMPTLDLVKFNPIKAQLAGEVPRHHRPLIHQLLGYLQAHPDAYCGDGHGTTLLEHHLGVMDQAFEYEGADPLLALAAAAHDIGKTISHAKQDGEWVRLSPHDKEGGRLLPKFPAWWELPDDERAILLLAVKYEHSPSKMPRTFPGLTGKDLRRATTLLHQLREIDGLTTRSEKSKVLESVNVEELAIDAFLRVIPLVPYQVKGLAKGVKAAGFRVGDRLFLSEPMIREAALTKLGQGVAEALGGGYRAPGKTGQFTQILLKALHDRGWLVTEAEGVPEGSETSKTWTLPADQALWRVRSGIIEFRGMIAVELPEEHHGLYPRETAYEVTVIGPLRTSAGSGVVPTKDSGKREERAEIPKSIPASEVCEVSLFAASQPGGDAGKVEPSAFGGDVAQKGEEAPGAGSAPAQGEASKGDVSWLLDDGFEDTAAPVGGNAAQKEEPAAGGDAEQEGEPVGGDVAQKGEESAGSAGVPAPKSNTSWLLEDDDSASTAPVGGDAAQEEWPAAGGNAAQKGEPVGGDVAQKGEESAGSAGVPAPKSNTSWLLEDDDSASTAPVGGDAAQEEWPAAGGNAAQKGEPVGGDVAQKGEESAGSAGVPAPKSDASWLLEDDDSASTAPVGGDAAQEEWPAAGGNAAQKGEPVGGDVAQKGEESAGSAGVPAPKSDASWLLEDDDSASTAPVGGDAAQEEWPAAGGNAAQKGEEPAGAAGEPAPKTDASWLLGGDDSASTTPVGGNAAQKGEPVGGDVAQKGEESAGAAGEPAPKTDASWLLGDDDSASTTPVGGNAAQKEEAPAGGDAAQKGEEPAGAAGEPAPKSDASWLLDGDDSPSTAPVGGNAAQEGEPVGGDAAPKTEPVGGNAAQKAEPAGGDTQEDEAKLSPIERRLQKRRAKAKKAGASAPGSGAPQAGSDNGAGAKGKRAKAEVAGPPKLFS
ncbi:hypothetical protein FIU88_18035 (plasmid) [Halomonas sp. THAF12]|uniref:HD domain-containing protein n=1 Tax=Halomonas sp. THAF12 TaxID=2587849 RepID=UPI0012689883|nr:HD domain-containing protein [Halomonas sp. THAF12]QFT86850.1 hypothetical protein FIU88_18035 [Halomonas sp. THAF12]